MNWDAKERSMTEANDSCIGPYTGQVVQRFHTQDFFTAIHDLPRSLMAPENPVLDALRNRTVCVPLPDHEGKMVSVAVKSFCRPSHVRSQRYRRQGSKARRSWRVARYLAERGVGTPKPLGFLERWDQDQLVESYFLTEFQADAMDARSVLRRLFDPATESKLLDALLQLVACEVRGLHAVGIQHNDLGYQNILVQRNATGWGNPQFIDLNRASIRAALSARQRARDVKSLWLPKRLRSVFFTEYFGGRSAPIDFQLWETWYRALDELRNATRDWRHPVQTQSLRARGLTRPVYPSATYRS